MEILWILSAANIVIFLLHTLLALSYFTPLTTSSGYDMENWSVSSHKCAGNYIGHSIIMIWFAIGWIELNGTYS